VEQARHAERGEVDSREVVEERPRIFEEEVHAFLFPRMGEFPRVPSEG
jgi:hypothetical protein